MLTYRDTPKGKVLSAGYPTVEDLIDCEDFEPINTDFEAAYAKLEELSRKQGGLKTSKDAGKAMRSIEMVMDLLRELLSIKYSLQDLSKGEKR